MTEQTERRFKVTGEERAAEKQPRDLSDVCTPGGTLELETWLQIYMECLRLPGGTLTGYLYELKDGEEAPVIPTSAKATRVVLGMRDGQPGNSDIEWPEGQVQAIEYLSPRYIKLEGKEYTVDLEVIHAPCIPQHLIQDRKMLYCCPSYDFWSFNPRVEKPAATVAQIIDSVSSNIEGYLNAEDRKAGSRLIVSPVQMQMTVAGPVLQCELWTWVGKLTEGVEPEADNITADKDK